MKKWDVFVVGGGLAGLAAATYLAREEKTVALLERAQHPGGHAITQNHDGYRLNLGPHALYMKGAGISVLRELGIEPQGTRPGGSGSYMYLNRRLDPLPDNPLKLLTSSFGPLRARIEVARFLFSVTRIRPAELAHLAVDEWLSQSVRTLEAREMIQALIRVATYTNAPAMQSAEFAAAQLQGALRGGVLYLHEGWQSLVDALRNAAVQAGAHILTSTRVDRIEISDRVDGLRLADGTFHQAPAIVLAVPPAEAARLLPANAVVHDAAENAVPVRAATLDVALRELPDPHRWFALGIDKPYYYSLHSRWARLAPEGGAVLHVAKYLAPEEPSAEAEELESFLDQLQPGWRGHVVVRRFFPSIVVNSALVTAKQGGFKGRTPVDGAGIPGLFLAGDWIGDTGFLADASLASARAAAQALLQQQRPLTRVA